MFGVDLGVDGVGVEEVFGVGEGVGVGFVVGGEHADLGVVKDFRRPIQCKQHKQLHNIPKRRMLQIVKLSHLFLSFFLLFPLQFCMYIIKFNFIEQLL